MLRLGRREAADVTVVLLVVKGGGTVRVMGHLHEPTPLITGMVILLLLLIKLQNVLIWVTLRLQPHVLVFWTNEATMDTNYMS